MFTILPKVLIWMDLEMTGLDPHRHVIVEIATVVTDDDLTVLAVGPDLVLSASANELAEMGDYVSAMHTASGLLEAISSSDVTREQAEAQTLAFLRSTGAEAGAVPLAGNSIGTDRRFLQEYMPQLERFFHYRNVDVSTIKELAQRWRPDVAARRPDKAIAHRALDDVMESIAELDYYRGALFTPGEPTGATPPAR
jgi:oligoribonuclease